MIDIGKSDIVLSLNGREAGKRFIVIATDGEYSMLADGRGRRVEKPKKKKNKHVKVEETTDNLVAEKLKSGDKVTNSEIRRVLAEYSKTRGE